MDFPASKMSTECGKVKHLSLEVEKRAEKSAHEIDKVEDLNVEIVVKQEVKQEVKPEASTQESKWRPMRKEGDEANLKLFEKVKKQEKPIQIPEETRGEYQQLKISIIALF